MPVTRSRKRLISSGLTSVSGHQANPAARMTYVHQCSHSKK